MKFKVIIQDEYGNQQEIGNINDSMLLRVKVWIKKFGNYLPELKEQEKKI